MDASGSSAAWFLHELLPAFEAGGPPVDDMEADMLRRIFADTSASPSFSWEGLTYRTDLKGPVRASTLAIRAAMAGPRLQHLALLDAAARQLQSPKTLAEVAAITTSLERAVPVMTTNRLADRVAALKRIRASRISASPACVPVTMRW